VNNAFHIGKLFGISLRLHYSWFFIFVLVTVSLAFNFLSSDFPLWQRLTGGIITSLLFFASVVTHELTHSLVARKYGIPVSNITLFIFGGAAQITREADRPGAELLMAAAGPLSSFALAGLFGVLWLAVRESDAGVAPVFIYWLALINLLLGAFNLIPGFPLDGGRVLRAILWKARGNYKQATRVASLTGRGVAYLFILTGIAVALLLGAWFNGLWLAFIGWFLENAASASYRQAQLRDALLNLTAAQIMAADCVAVPSSTPLSQLVQEYVLPGGRRCLLVMGGGGLEGIITLNNIRAVPRQRWDTTSVRETMIPASSLKVARPEDDALSVLNRMEESGIDQVPVVESGRVIGLVSRDSLFRFMRTRTELGV
jgi:Zn-dependent protease